MARKKKKKFDPSTYKPANKDWAKFTTSNHGQGAHRNEKVYDRKRQKKEEVRERNE